VLVLSVIVLLVLSVLVADVVSYWYCVFVLLMSVFVLLVLCKELSRYVFTYDPILFLANGSDL